jgi:hypothetical protein
VHQLHAHHQVDVEEVGRAGPVGANPACQRRQVDDHLQARQPADIGDIAFPFNPHARMPKAGHVLEQVAHPLARAPVQQQRLLDIIHRQHRPEGNPFGRDDIAQLAPLGALDFDVALGDEPLEMPVHRPHGHA